MTRPDIATTVEHIDAIPADDPERAHYLADAALLGYVPEEITQAYMRLVDRCAWWATA